jgi:hypothetical protein
MCEGLDGVGEHGDVGGVLEVSLKDGWDLLGCLFPFVSGGIRKGGYKQGHNHIRHDTTSAHRLPRWIMIPSDVA